MKKIDKYIGELLYDHECVIVPELGGFLSSYVSSKVHTGRQMVLPPSKKIAFNVYLKQNDGLLANHVVKSQQVTYPEALKEIEGYVQGCQRDLGDGKKYMIERVGILSKDAEANIQFEPFANVNYLKESFGLSPVQYVPVQNSEFDQQVEKHLRDFISLRPSQAQARPAVYKKKVPLNGLNAMLLSGSLVWLCLNIYIISPTKVNFASLNPFAVSTEVPEAKPQVYTQPNVSRPETVFVKTTEPVIVPETIPSPAEKLNEAIAASTIPGSYFIVAGAFNSTLNASKKAAELRSEGFQNAHVIVNKDGLKLVCYAAFTTRENAVDELNKLKSLNKEGWIFSR